MWTQQPLTLVNTQDTTQHRNTDPPSWHATGSMVDKRNAPYQGPFRMVTWSAQGLLAYDINNQRNKKRKYNEKT